MSAATGPGGSAFPWEAALRFGIGRLRLHPEAFWALTPAELALLAGPAREPALSRTELAALMRRLSDITGDEA